MRFLYIGIGAVLGAWSRYGVSLLLQRFIIADFPWATFVVNVLGSFGIGFLLPYLAKNATVNIKLFAITGYLGAFTTFSTFSIEALQLFQKCSILLHRIQCFMCFSCRISWQQFGKSLEAIGVLGQGILENS